MTVDIAHPPLTGTEAEQVLDESLRSVRGSSSLRILKIIHGYGSSGKGGSLKEAVRNWCYARRAKVRAVVAGEDATPFNENARTIASACGLSVVSDLGPPNDGVTIVWVA